MYEYASHVTNIFITETKNKDKSTLTFVYQDQKLSH